MPEERITAGIIRTLECIKNSFAILEPLYIEELQHLVLAKTAFNEDKSGKLRTTSLWGNMNDLMYMLIDGGVRDHVIDMYGIYRKFTDGYRFGQEVLSNIDILRGIKRVAA